MDGDKYWKDRVRGTTFPLHQCTQKPPVHGEKTRCHYSHRHSHGPFITKQEREGRASVPKKHIAPGCRWYPQAHPTCHPKPSLHFPPASPSKGAHAGGWEEKSKEYMLPYSFPKEGRDPDGEDKGKHSELPERCIMFINPSPGGRARTPVGAWVLRGERDPHCRAGGAKWAGWQGCVLSIQIPDGRFRGGLALFLPRAGGTASTLRAAAGDNWTHTPHRMGRHLQPSHPPNPKPASSQRDTRRSLPPGQDFPVKPQPRQTKG